MNGIVLGDGEKIVWAGQPAQLKLSENVVLFCIGLLFAAFGAVPVFLIIQGAMNGALDLSTEKHQGVVAAGLFFVIPLFFGCLMLIAPWTTARARRTTHYAITKQRVIIVSNSGGKRQVSAYNRAELQLVTDQQYYGNRRNRILWKLLNAKPEQIRKSKFNISECPVVSFENLNDTFTPLRAFENGD